MSYRTEGEADAGPATPGVEPIQPPSVRYRSPSGEPSPAFDITPAAPWEPSGPATPIGFERAGTASLVLGTLAVVCTGVFFFLFPLGLALGLGAVALGQIGRRRARRGLATNQGTATAGFTLGVLALVLGTVLAALTIWFVRSHDAGAIRECIANETGAVDAGRCILDVVEDS